MGRQGVGGRGDRLAYREVGVRRCGAQGLDSRTGEEFRAEAGGKAGEKGKLAPTGFFVHERKERHRVVKGAEIVLLESIESLE